MQHHLGAVRRHTEDGRDLGRSEAAPCQREHRRVARAQVGSAIEDVRCDVPLNDDVARRRIERDEGAVVVRCIERRLGCAPAEPAPLVDRSTARDRDEPGPEPGWVSERFESAERAANASCTMSRRASRSCECADATRSTAPTCRR